MRPLTPSLSPSRGEGRGERREEVMTGRDKRVWENI